jgi:hypothetical protein
MPPQRYPYHAHKRLSPRETCRQLVEQECARRHRNHAKHVLRAELGVLAAVVTEVIAHLAFCAG